VPSDSDISYLGRWWMGECDATGGRTPVHAQSFTLLENTLMLLE
jgi:hypothetical protein